MTRHTKARNLARAVQSLMPEADICILHERPWHSLTFCGAQICLAAQLPENVEKQLASLAHLLENHEFALPGQMVADIAVTETAIFDGKYRLIIDVLLLDD